MHVNLPVTSADYGADYIDAQLNHSTNPENLLASMTQDSAAPFDQLKQAWAAYQSGQVENARRSCAQLLEAVSPPPGAFHLMARLSLDSGDTDQALQLLRQAIDLSPQSTEFICELAFMQLQLGQTEMAADLFQQALAITPQILPARLQLASIYHRSDDYEKALHHYKLALDLAADLAELHCQIGVCEFQLGHLSAARSWFQSCLGLEPGHLDCLENLARNDLAAREFTSANQVLQQLLKLAPERGEAHHLLGFVFLHLGDIPDASESFLNPIRKRFAENGPGGKEPADTLQVTHTKLRHDLEQLEYLKEQGLLPPERLNLIEQYRQALALLPPPSPQQFFYSCPQIPQFNNSYNRLLEDFRPGQISGSALNPNLDQSAIEDTFKSQGWVYFDDFLNPQALAGLQEFCLRSSIWFEKKFQFEVGASLRNGFCCPLLLQIGEELREFFPHIFGPHLFSGCFSYKYYQQGVDGHVHADRGAVSLNFWTTPDEANLDPTRGGLVIWNKRVPKEYFHASPERIDRIHAELIEAADAVPATIAYRCNRAMLFHSDVLHRSDQMQFKDHYSHRRVSMTYLYGKPGDIDTSSLG